MAKSVNVGEPAGPSEATAPKALATARGEVDRGRARRFGEAAVKSHRLDYATQEKSGAVAGEGAVQRAIRTQDSPERRMLQGMRPAPGRARTASTESEDDSPGRTWHQRQPPSTGSGSRRTRDDAVRTSGRGRPKRHAASPIGRGRRLRLRRNTRSSCSADRFRSVFPVSASRFRGTSEFRQARDAMQAP